MWVDSKVASALSPPGQLAREFCERHRRPGETGPTNNFAVDDVEHVCVGLHQFGGDLEHALRAVWSAARRVASPHITVTREANAPMPLSMRSVWPWITLILRVIDAERVGADLRDHGFDALADARRRR